MQVNFEPSNFLSTLWPTRGYGDKGSGSASDLGVEYLKSGITLLGGDTREILPQPGSYIFAGLVIQKGHHAGCSIHLEVVSCQARGAFQARVRGGEKGHPSVLGKVS